MRKKIGRPTDNPKDAQMPVRLSSDEIEKLEYCSQKTGKSKAEIIRIGINKVWESIEESEEEEMEDGDFLSFQDTSGQDIPFEDYTLLRVKTQKDIVSGRITEYLVEYDDGIYPVNKETYEFIKERTFL